MNNPLWSATALLCLVLFPFDLTAGGKKVQSRCGGNYAQPPQAWHRPPQHYGRPVYYHNGYHNNRPRWPERCDSRDQGREWDHRKHKERRCKNDNDGDLGAALGIAALVGVGALAIGAASGAFDGDDRASASQYGGSSDSIPWGILTGRGTVKSPWSDSEFERAPLRRGQTLYDTMTGHPFRVP